MMGAEPAVLLSILDTNLRGCRRFPDRLLTNYLRHKHLLTTVTSDQREQYYRTLLESSIMNSKKMWSNINCILGKKINTTINKINTTIMVDSLTISPQIIYYHPQNLALDQEQALNMLY